MVKKYPLFDIYWDKKDIKSVNNIIRRGSHWATGPEIREFEEKLGKYFKVKHVLSFNSGTSALHALLLAYGIRSGEVIVPSLSFISTANCVILAGARPIFAEIEEDTIGLDPENVKEKVSNKTRAIIPMHYGGKVCKNIEIIREIAEDFGLILIEDSAESFGAKINNKFAGTMGHAGMFSFCQNKILTTGEGGAICTNDEVIYKKLLFIRSHGEMKHLGKESFSNIYESDYVEVGYNFRIPTMCAALGISQLEKIEKIIKIRREKGKYYDKNLEKIPNIQIIPEINGQRTVYQLYSIFLKNPEKREDLQNFLSKNGIFTKVYFNPIHLMTFYKVKFGYREGDLPITEEISKKILTLPFSYHFTNDDQDFIISKIKQFF